MTWLGFLLVLGWRAFQNNSFNHPSRGSGVIVLKRNFNTAEFACLYSPSDSKL